MLLDFKEIMYKGWAGEFVKLYYHNSPLEAVYWLEHRVPIMFHKELEPFIIDAFHRLGYRKEDK